MLITDLSSLEGLRVVERVRLNDVLAELELAKSDFIDPSTAASLGQGLGATFVLTGSFAAVEPQMRIDARVVAVSTGEVVASREVTGPAGEFFLLEKELASAVTTELGVVVSARENARLGRVATESFDAFRSWSEGLEAIDRGDLEAARGALERSLQSDDRFALADDVLGELRDKLAQHGQRSAELRDEQARQLLAKIDELAAAGGPWTELEMALVQVQMKLNYYSAPEDVMALSRRLIDLELPEEVRLGGAYGVMSINEWAMFNYTMACQTLARTSEFLTWGQAFLDRYPTSTYGDSIRPLMQLSLDQLDKQRQGRAEVPRARAEATAMAWQGHCVADAVPTARLAACQRWVQVLDEGGVEIEARVLESLARAALAVGDRDAMEAARQRELALRPTSEDAEDIADLIKRHDRYRARADNSEADRSAAEPRNVRKSLDDLVRSGALDEARRGYEQALVRWPADGALHKAHLHLLIVLGDLPAAEAAVEAWRVSGADKAPDDAALRRVESLREQLGRSWQPDALAASFYASRLFALQQWQEAGDAFSKLADDYPTWDGQPAPRSLDMAAQAYRQGGLFDRARAAWRRVIDEHPESSEASSARTMLEHLP